MRESQTSEGGSGTEHYGAEGAAVNRYRRQVQHDPDWRADRKLGERLSAIEDDQRAENAQQGRHGAQPELSRRLNSIYSAAYEILKVLRPPVTWGVGTRAGPVVTVLTATDHGFVLTWVF
ncbi:hypothetical protein NYO98_06460 [Nocardioides sp. STR2]|uniref:Uncharacterized protein n=1 Tax=Nocardioides pini TaxID=2975053 RepID=A0ABT4CAC0_9ACTN|nr:hypothetical protein [Nocardioides pini]MCY4725914.1 hypothetical protein [Nocardioides pini]